MGKGHTKIVIEIRRRLREYGVDKDESICDALDRLLAEHARALLNAEMSWRTEEDAIREAAEARRTRDAAQAASTADCFRARAATFENFALRKILDGVVRQLGEKAAREYEQAAAEAVSTSKKIAADAGVARIADELFKEGHVDEDR